MDRYWLSGSITSLSQVLYLCTSQYVPEFISYTFLGVGVLSAFYLFYISKTYKEVIGSFLWIVLPAPVSILFTLLMIVFLEIFYRGFGPHVWNRLSNMGYGASTITYLVVFAIGPILLGIAGLKMGHLIFLKKRSHQHK